mmetsp:Transcript_3155/g.4199  ORF Transcript_3155/g.4199 Transcript_3155/m.4199 type:complete len:147 (+) Transcript_3155:49-489(+)
MHSIVFKTTAKLVTMNKALLSFLLLLSIAASTVSGFSVAAPRVGGVNGGSSFVVAQKFSTVAVPVQPMKKGDMQMGKMAKFGIFSPLVYGAKIVLGQDKLNKLRGKGIGLHSQVIGDFAGWSGAYHLRTRLIKKAKTNGDILGFLV